MVFPYWLGTFVVGETNRRSKDPVDHWNVIFQGSYYIWYNVCQLVTDGSYMGVTRTGQNGMKEVANSCVLFYSIKYIENGLVCYIRSGHMRWNGEVGSKRSYA